MTNPGSYEYSRRRTLRGVALTATGLTVALAGCASGVEEGPTPTVVWTEADPPIAEITSQRTAEITAMVANHGDDSEIAVTANTRQSGREDPIDSKTVTIDLDGSDQKTISFEMTISPSAEYLDTTAE